MEGLRAAVVAQGADMGVAWDGDGDRLGIVDEGGGRHDPDAILTLLAWDLLSRRPGARVLVDVKVSLATIRAIEAHGGRPVFGPTGHSRAKRLMREAGILLGGEASSHFYFREDYFGFDDAIFGACLIAQLVSARGRPLSALMAGAGGTGPALLTSPELRIPCDDAAEVPHRRGVRRALPDIAAGAGDRRGAHRVRRRLGAGARVEHRARAQHPPWRPRVARRTASSRSGSRRRCERRA